MVGCDDGWNRDMGFALIDWERRLCIHTDGSGLDASHWIDITLCLHLKAFI